MGSPERPILETKETLRPQTITILQWNVWHRAKKEDTLDYLQTINADVLCLQEVLTDSSNTPNVDIPTAISQEFGMEAFFEEDRYLRYDRLERKDRYLRDGTGIFSRFPMLRRDSTILSEGGWDKFRERQIRRRYAEVDIEIPGRFSPLTIATTHLSFPLTALTKPRIRRKEIEKLTDIVSQKQSRFILTGDFNSQPDKRPVRKTRENLELVSNPDEHTYQRRMLGREWNRTLDYAFATPDIQVIRVEVLNQGPSDHKPILLKIAV